MKKEYFKWNNVIDELPQESIEPHRNKIYVRTEGFGTTLGFF